MSEDAEKRDATAATARKTVSLPVSTLVAGAVAAVLVAVAVVTTGLWLSARGDLDDIHAATAAEQHAEQVATDYAVGASNIDFADLGAWQGRLKANTTGKLSEQFDAAGPKLSEALTVLKWTSSATPIAAKVTGRDGDAYLVDVFLDVTSTNAQNPQGVKTTVTYNVTVNPDGWTIADVGGMDMTLPQK
ncbi:Uncharacterised protein [Nocardia otitidiscaviarum]|uniref:Mce-associated membrane protein n=1 Tax=Nocardia otitidiscaviarum TaxID=1823 RepID=A0A378YM32_9NOCA|nr:hypothetical protein [Nocardia otitidiscaviarum]MBF6181597.1 hypothetical protein [Nocardia otitidiscaviarum]MBF6240641.1 hypothetical protein [Nocardia otitidiscaviarum]MBF6486791.1 hypothetical protein [Nocardia otitidiscaviarum]SUA77479.1 Uncharacterised protein [Nocardia otitidiscaviarum]